MIQSKLPAREIAVCQRLRELRVSLKLDQPTFAAALEISRERLASYENFRAPLRYALAEWICHRFDVNQRWLATGKLPQFYVINVHSSIRQDIKPRELFSSAYDRVLKDGIEHHLRRVSQQLGCKPEELKSHAARTTGVSGLGEIGHDALIHHLTKLITDSAVRVPDHLLSDY